MSYDEQLGGELSLSITEQREPPRGIRWVLRLYQRPSANAGWHLLSVQVNEIYAKWSDYMGIQATYGKGY